MLNFKKDLIDPRQILSILKRRKWLLIIPLVLVPVVGVASSYLITPVYESSVTIWIGNSLLLSSDLQRLVGDFGRLGGDDRGRARDTEGLRKEVTSTAYLAQLVIMMGLDQDPAVEKRAAELQAMYPQLSVEQIKQDLVIDRLRGNIRVYFVGNNYLRISVTAPDAVFARDFARNLGQVFVQEKERQEKMAINISSDFSYTQLAKYERELQRLIDKKTELEKEILQSQDQNLSTLQANRVQMEAELQATSLEIDGQKETELSLRSELTSISNSDLEALENPSIRQKREEIRSSYLALRGIMQRQLWDNASVSRQKVRIFNQERELETEIRRAVDLNFASLSPTEKNNIVDLMMAKERLAMLNTHSSNLTLAVSSLDGRQSLLPEFHARLEQVNREISAARDLRDRFKLQQESFSISQAILEESRFKTIEPAKVPYGPIWPDRTQIGLVSLLIGLLIGGAAVFVSEAFDATVRRPDDDNKVLGIEVLGTIPKIEKLDRALQVK